MNVLQAIILGLTQGLTEFIPVSSSGHLILVQNWLGLKQDLFAFNVALDIGTLAALLLFFWPDFWELFLSIFKKNEKTRLAWLLVLATIPAAAVGFLFNDYIEKHLQLPIIVAVNLIWVALVMLWADHKGRKNQKLDDADVPKAVTVGVAQALALVPGISRSGITIAAGLADGFDRVSATKFSFLLSAPIIAGATAKVVLKGTTIAAMKAEPSLYLAGILAAAISGYLAIKFLINYLSKHGLQVFAYYRIIVGVIVLIMALR